MSDDDSKPAAESTPFTAEDAMAFMQRMWNPFAMPMPGGAPTGATARAPAPQAGTPAGRAAGSPAGDASDAPSTPRAFDAAAATAFGSMPGMLPGMLPFPNPATMFAALDPVEIERKIDELRVIEGWLAMSLNLIQMSIKTLELQVASLEALQGAAQAPAARKRTRRPAGG